MSASFTNNFLYCFELFVAWVGKIITDPCACPVIKFLFLNNLLVKPDAAGCIPVEQIPAVHKEKMYHG